MNTSGFLHEDFFLFLFLHTHRDATALAGELSEESDQFRFLRAAHLDHLKGSFGLILSKDSAPLDLSSP